MVDDNTDAGRQDRYIAVFLDECVSGLCSCHDVEHLPDSGISLIRQKAPQGYSDRRVMCYFFRLIKSGRILEEIKGQRRFVFLTQDRKFIRAVAREEKSKPNCNCLQTDSARNFISSDGATIYICKVRKNSCPIQQLNEFVGSLTGS